MFLKSVDEDLEFRNITEIMHVLYNQERIISIMVMALQFLIKQVMMTQSIESLNI